MTDQQLARAAYDTVVPPYHVQTGAYEMRDGFPYFTHHDGISALWTQKWRPPCAAGSYPFVDGDVSDFDPIFDRLRTEESDDPAVLLRPDDYAAFFLPTGHELSERADAAASRGDVEQARSLFLRAAAVFRIARFPLNRSPLTQQAWQLGKAAYLRGSALLDPPNVAIDIPFAHADPGAGDVGDVVPAYLRAPAGEPPPAGWPVLLFVCGLDAYRTDNTSRIQQHIDRGYTTISFEIPGTGDCPAAPGDPDSPDRLLDSVLDWVEAAAAERHFDTGHVVLRGISTGGYYAIRAAHTHADRLYAVAEQGGGCHHMFDPAWILAQNQMEYPYALGDAMAYKFGFRDGEDPVVRYAANAHRFSLNTTGVLDRPSCRLLLVNGMEDSIFPIEDTFLVGRRGSGKDIVARGDKGHMGNPGGEDIVYAWLDDVVRRPSQDRQAS